MKSALCEVVDVERLILNKLSFGDKRVMNQVNWRYNLILNKEYLTLYPSKDPRETLKRMMQRGDLEACQWLYARHPSVRVSLPAAISGGPSILQWCREIGQIKDRPQQSEQTKRDANYFRLAWETNSLSTIEYVLTKVPEWTRCYQMFLHSANFEGLKVSTLEQLKQFMEEKEWRMMNWSLYLSLTSSRAELQVLNYRVWIRDGRVELLEWVQAQSKSSLRIPLDLCLQTAHPQTLSWSQLKYGYDYSPYYWILFNRAQVRQNLPMVEWILQQGYTVPLSSLGDLSREVYSLIYRYQPTPALLQHFRQILVTRRWRYPPHPRSLYQWLLTLPLAD